MCNIYVLRPSFDPVLAATESHQSRADILFSPTPKQQRPFTPQSAVSWKSSSTQIAEEKPTLVKQSALLQFIKDEERFKINTTNILKLSINSSDDFNFLLNTIKN